MRGRERSLGCLVEAHPPMGRPANGHSGGPRPAGWPDYEGSSGLGQPKSSARLAVEPGRPQVASEVMGRASVAHPGGPGRDRNDRERAGTRPSWAESLTLGVRRADQQGGPAQRGADVGVAFARELP